jgi:transposase
MGRRKRRTFTAEQTAEAVRLVQRGNRSLGQVAPDLDLTRAALARAKSFSRSDSPRLLQARLDATCSRKSVSLEALASTKLPLQPGAREQ